MKIQTKIRVILVDDHNLVRSGLAALLSQDGRFEVVDEATNGVEGIEKINNTPSDLLIVDLAMPRLGGIELITDIRRTNRRLKILVLSMYDDAQFVARALKVGANGYLLKQALDEDLFHAIESVFDGEQFVSNLIDRDALREFTFDDSDLTSREREVLHLIAEGKTNGQIARVLSISPHTVTRHRANLMKKLNVHNRVELINVANSRGLIVMPRRTEL
jgi:DNA-binding NarL/FixJ family response regulator